MAGLAKENFQEEFELDQIRQNKRLTPKIRQSMIDETRKSFFNRKKNSSWTTILNISNNMIGSSILIFPLVFMKFGFINAIAVLFLLAVISCETCILQIRHVKLNEMDLPESIRRILGRKWFCAYVFSSFIFNMFSVVIYFILMTSLLYSILEYFFVIGWETPLIEPVGEGGRDMVFERFSKEWAQISMAILMVLLYSIPYLRYLLIISQYGILGVFFYVFYLFAKAGINIYEGNVGSQSIKYVSPDISTLAGIFSLAFFVHNNLVTIVKANQHPEKNTRDVTISFILTGALYLSIGVCGGIAIAGSKLAKTPQTVLDYFGDSFWVIIIDILIFLQLLSVSPLCWYIGRTQLLEMKYQHDPTPKSVVFLINVLFVGLCLTLNLLKVDVTLIISMNGAVCGYIMLYLIPIKLHLNCLYDSHDGEVVYNGEVLMKNYDLSYFTPDSPQQRKWQSELRERELIEDLRMSKLAMEIDRNECRSPHLTLIQGHSKLNRYLIYGVMSIFGLVIAIWEIVLICTGNF